MRISSHVEQKGGEMKTLTDREQCCQSAVVATMIALGLLGAGLVIPTIIAGTTALLATNAGLRA